MRLEQSQMQPLTTYVAPLGILSRSLLCLLIFGGEYGYAQVDLSGGRHSHGGMGWLKADDGSGTHLPVTVDYHESDSGYQRRSESGIPLSLGSLLSRRHLSRCLVLEGPSTSHISNPKIALSKSNSYQTLPDDSARCPCGWFFDEPEERWESKTFGGTGIVQVEF
jgi:hypothetical protein